MAELVTIIVYKQLLLIMINFIQNDEFLLMAV